MSLVTSLDELKLRQKKFDELAEELYSKAKGERPDIDQLVPAVLDPVRCVVIKKGSKPSPIEVSLDVVKAIRLRSIKHRPPPGQPMTCIKCEVKYDDYGYVIGVVHHWMHDEDTEITQPDGTKTAVPGLKTRIEQRKVKLLSDYEVEVSE